jgi:hypothetical protein
VVRLLRPYGEPTCGMVPGSHRLRSNGLIRHRSNVAEATPSSSAGANPRAARQVPVARLRSRAAPRPAKAELSGLRFKFRLHPSAYTGPPLIGRASVGDEVSRLSGHGLSTFDLTAFCKEFGSAQNDRADRGIQPVHPAAVRPPMENGGRRLCNSHRPCASRLPYRISLSDQPFRLSSC